MREYTSLSNTPLGFHRFFLYLCLPIDLVCNGGAFLIGLLTLTHIAPLSLLQLSTNMGVMLLVIMILAGAGRWQNYSYYSIFALIWLHMGYSLFTSGFYVFYSLDMLFFALFGAFFMCIFGSLTMLYYMNRRPLFFPNESAFLQEEVMETAPQAPLDPPLDTDFIGEDSYTFDDTAFAGGEGEPPLVPVAPSDTVMTGELATALDSPPAVAVTAVTSDSTATSDPAAPAISINFCTSCGAKISHDEARFCHHCGGKLR